MNVPIYYNYYYIQIYLISLNMLINLTDFSYLFYLFQKRERKCLYIGDSWFGSVKACGSVGELGHHGIFVVKTGHSRTPKAFLEKTMESMPGGTWITLRGKDPLTNQQLVSTGYKYGRK